MDSIIIRNRGSRALKIFNHKGVDLGDLLVGEEVEIPLINIVSGKNEKEKKVMRQSVIVEDRDRYNEWKHEVQKASGGG